MSLEEASKNVYNTCVVGSGPAGIIFTLEYVKKNPSHKVVLIEYGHAQMGDQNSLDDKIQIHNRLNHHDPYECTNKGLGGTTATWGGRCVMYDKIDFMDRRIISDECTWDLSLFEEVKLYADKAAN